MTKYGNRFLLVALIFLVSACGFHLKGMGGETLPLPFNTLMIDNSTSLSASLDKVFLRDKRVTLVDAAGKADALLKVDSEYTQRDILVINRGGNVNEYLLVLAVRAQLFKNGVSYAEPMEVSVRRTYTYSDNQMLGKQEEEAVLWNDMRIEAAEQILRRLSYLRPNLDLQPAKTEK